MGKIKHITSIYSIRYPLTDLFISLTLIQDDCRSKDHYSSVEKLQEEQHNISIMYSFRHKSKTKINTLLLYFQIDILCKECKFKARLRFDICFNINCIIYFYDYMNSSYCGYNELQTSQELHPSPKPHS